MKKYLYKNELKSLTEIAKDKDCRVSFKTLWQRVNTNWSLEDATSIRPYEIVKLEIGYYIYLITNLINSKKYIGRTTRLRFQQRWTEHLSESRKLHKKEPLYRAIRKYGEENFSFEIIDTAKNGKELALLESKYIIQYDTLCPKGYNLELYQEYRKLSNKSKKKISKSQQGLKRKNHTSNYIGVYKSGDCGWRCEIAKDRVKYGKTFKSEKFCAIAYDLIALYLYGKRAKINFIDKRNQWLKSNLKKFFDFFKFERPILQENGLYFDKSRNRWRARFYFDGIQYYNGQFKTKEEAANANLKFYEENLIK